MGKPFRLSPSVPLTPHVSPVPLSSSQRKASGSVASLLTFTLIAISIHKITICNTLRTTPLPRTPTNKTTSVHFVAYTHSESCTASSISTHSPFYVSSYQHGEHYPRGVDRTHLRIRRQVAPQPHTLAPVDRVRAPLDAGRGQRRGVRVLPKPDRAEALKEAHEHERDLVVRELHVKQ